MASNQAKQSGLSSSIKHSRAYWGQRLTDLTLLAPAFVLLSLFYFVPIVLILAVSLTEPTLGFANYTEMVLSAPLRNIFATTFKVSAQASFISLLFGYLIAFVLVSSGPRMSRTILVLVWVPFWISTLVRAFSWIVILRSNGLLNNALQAIGLTRQPLDLMFNERAVLIGVVHYLIPLAALTMYAQMRSIDGRYVRAARGLGASPFAAFLLVFAPLSLPGVIAAAILTFISVLGFFITPAILGGGKSLMIAEYISFLISQTLNWGLGTTLAVGLMIAVFALLGLLSRLVNVDQLYGAR